MADIEKKPTWHVKPKMRSHARTLRRELTNAERIIWHAVRAHRLSGASFRRQTPVGPYIVDFISHPAKLVIEIDGGQHFETGHERRDAKRDAFLVSKGYRVLRFNNHEVMTNRQGVLTVIVSAIEEAPSPTLPRKRGRERTDAAALPHKSRRPGARKRGPGGGGSALMPRPSPTRAGARARASAARVGEGTRRSKPQS
jgi:very-short-patch-repair endonuclease